LAAKITIGVSGDEPRGKPSKMSLTRSEVRGGGTRTDVTADRHRKDQKFQADSPRMMAENPIMTSVRFLRGACWILFASMTVAACGGGDGGGGGEGDDDSGNAGDAGESGTSGTSGSDTGGNESGGSGGDNGGTTSKGGSGGKGGTSGTGTGATGPALDRIEDACGVDCDAQFALECAPASQNTLTCKYQCAAQTGQLGDFCLTEYAEVVECRGAGGYACVMDRPYQNSTCAVEQLALSMCIQDLGCKRACDKSVDEGCTSMSLDECIDACIAKGDAVPMDCSYYTDSIEMCKVTSSATCVDGELSAPEACNRSVSLAECIADETMDDCEGWCWAADELGCGGDDCMTECANRLADATCGMAWQEVMYCGLLHDEAVCVDGFLAASGSICDTEQPAYTMCVGGGT
jgi:hypothetical protein